MKSDIRVKMLMLELICLCTNINKRNKQNKKKLTFSIRKSFFLSIQLKILNILNYNLRRQILS